jgi:anti-anti-sigma factor
VRIQQSSQDGCVVVAPSGDLDLAAVPPLRRALLARLGKQPLALICDLTGVVGLDPPCANLFVAMAYNAASQWPGTSMLLCSAQPAVAAVLRKMRLEALVPIHASVDDAFAHALDRPPYLRDVLHLGPARSAPASARSFVQDLCERWQIADGALDAVARAVLVASELVTNSVRHARTNIRLLVELRSARLHVSVHDDDPRLPHPLWVGPESENGRGLRLVADVAQGWGVHHHPGDGKVVWAVVDLG